MYQPGLGLDSARSVESDPMNIRSFHFISFHFISFHFISFHFISFHFISSIPILVGFGCLATQLDAVFAQTSTYPSDEKMGATAVNPGGFLPNPKGRLYA
jgi:hypothetical protein